MLFLCALATCTNFSVGCNLTVTVRHLKVPGGRPPGRPPSPAPRGLVRAVRLGHDGVPAQLAAQPPVRAAAGQEPGGGRVRAVRQQHPARALHWPGSAPLLARPGRFGDLLFTEEGGK